MTAAPRILILCGFVVGCPPPPAAAAVALLFFAARFARRSEERTGQRGRRTREQEKGRVLLQEESVVVLTYYIRGFTRESIFPWFSATRPVVRDLTQFFVVILDILASYLDLSFDVLNT